MRSRIPGLNLEKNRLKPGKDRFLVYFKKSSVEFDKLFDKLFKKLMNITGNS
jgi:hypothetical protein